MYFNNSLNKENVDFVIESVLQSISIHFSHHCAMLCIFPKRLTTVADCLFGEIVLRGFVNT